MSLLTESIPIETASDGTDLSTFRAGGILLHAIRLELGTLSTPDFTITEQPNGDSILAVAAVAADKTWYPSVLDDDAAGADVAGSARPYPVYDRIQIATAGGGANKTGRLILLYER